MVGFSTQKTPIPSTFRNEHWLQIVGRCEDLNIQDPEAVLVRISAEQFSEVVEAEFRCERILQVNDNRDPSNRHFNDYFNRQ